MENLFGLVFAVVFVCLGVITVRSYCTSKWTGFSKEECKKRHARWDKIDDICFIIFAAVIIACYVMPAAWLEVAQKYVMKIHVPIGEGPPVVYDASYIAAFILLMTMFIPKCITFGMESYIKKRFAPSK